MRNQYTGSYRLTAAHQDAGRQVLPANNASHERSPR